MGVIWEMCDRVAVMNQGELVEEGEVTAVLKKPQHPYTQKLIAAVPALNSEDLHQRKSDELLLAVKDLHTWYPVKRGLFARTVDHVKAVRGVSFEIYPGETLALVGESGCGKTTLGRTLMKLERAHSGSIHFEGVDLLACSKKQDREGRQHVQMVFQDPYSALNPRMKIWNILSEALVIHGLIPASEQRSRAQTLLEEVGLGAEHLDRYPHEFSGGQRQRICIARALGLKPKLIILDESLSALDVSIQAQVLDLLQDLKQRHDLAYLFISHDLSVVSQVADRIAVMKNGQIVEMGPPSEIVAKPKQAYTQALMASIPVLK
jgi:ABC-type glutathione transport system ATPase component